MRLLYKLKHRSQFDRFFKICYMNSVELALHASAYHANVRFYACHWRKFNEAIISLWIPIRSGPIWLYRYFTPQTFLVEFLSDCNFIVTFLLKWRVNYKVCFLAFQFAATMVPLPATGPVVPALLPARCSRPWSSWNWWPRTPTEAVSSPHRAGGTSIASPVRPSRPPPLRSKRLVFYV